VNRENYIMRSLMICTPYRILFGRSNREEWASLVARIWMGKVYAGFSWRNLREGDHLEDPGVDGRIMLRWIFRKWDVRHGLE